MDANLICAFLNRAAKVSTAYDYGVDCKTEDTCSIARVYFANKLLDLGSTCEGVTTLENHTSCYTYPTINPPGPTTQVCPITITEPSVTACSDITITVVQ